jgi:hypothetical protein
MEFNVQVKIDWLEEGGNIDDEIKSMIVNRIVGAVMVDVTKETEEIKKQAGETAKTKIAEWVDNFITQGIESSKILIPKTRYSSDGFKEMTLREIVDQQIGEIFDESVDKDGRATNSSYDRKGTRLEVLTGNIIQKIVDEKVKEQMKNINTQLSEYFTASMRNELMKQLTGAIVSNIDLKIIFKKQ